jgi:hypothetical protein
MNFVPFFYFFTAFKLPFTVGHDFFERGRGVRHGWVRDTKERCSTS